MTDPHLRATAGRFGAHARAFAASRLHEEGRTRLRLIEFLAPVADETLLDVGSGPGPVALAFAPLVRRVICLDAAAEMLRAAGDAARRRRIAGLARVRGDVHALPFATASLDLVIARACAHHFADLGRALAEIARVLRRGGRFGVADGTVPDDSEVDGFINDLDRLHDPTTVRNYGAREWRAALAGAGLRVDRVAEEEWELDEGRSLREWMARSGAGHAAIDEARRRLLAAPPRIRDYLRVRVDGDDVRFDLPRIVIAATRAG